jgi:hypothetical protein
MNLESLDKAESARVLERANDLLNNHSEDFESIFRNKKIPELIKKGNQAHVDGFDNELLPNSIPFSDKTFLQICTDCPCVKNPSLLTPYLERDQVIPILDSVYSAYPDKFIESIITYPHITTHEYRNYRTITILTQPKQPKTMSPKTFYKMRQECFELVKDITPRKETNIYLAREVLTFFANITPAFTQDRPLTKEFLTSCRDKNVNNIDAFSMLSHSIGAVRNIQAFSFMPQMKLKLENASALNNIQDANDLILNGLELAFNPKMPIDAYLDIISERKQKIRAIVNQIIDKSNPEKASFLSNLQSELERINEQGRTIDSSSKKLSIDFLTKFSLQNKGSIVACILAGLGVGSLGLGTVASVTSAITAAGVTKAASNKINILIPTEGRVLKERAKKKLEPYYEKMLAKSLSVDVEAIQVWTIKKEIKSIKT